MTHQRICQILELVYLFLGIQTIAAQIFIGDQTTPGILYAPLPDPRDDTNILDTSFTLIPLSEGSSVTGIDYDPANEMVYWSDFYNDQINRIQLDMTSPQEVIISTTTPHSVALDLVNGKIYWTMYNDAAISSANLDGSSVQKIYTYEGFAQPTLILVDSINEYLFWTARFADETARATLRATNITNKGVVKPVTAEAMVTEQCADQTIRLFYYTNYTELGFTNVDGSGDETLQVFSSPALGKSLMGKYGSKLFWIGMGAFTGQLGIYEYDLKVSSLTIHNTTVTLKDGSELLINPDSARIISTVPYDEPVAIEGCPDNIVAFIDDNSSNTSNTSSVSWVEPVFNSWSSCPRIDFLGPGTNGGNFPLGVTVVSYQARDAAGNSDTCEFTVTVQQATDVTMVPDEEESRPDCPGSDSGGVTTSSCTSIISVLFVSLITLCKIVLK